MTQKVYRLINAGLSSGNGSTSKVKISSADDSENYLDLKIAVQDGLTKEITNPTANEVLTLGLDVSQIDHNSLENYNVDEHRPVDDTQATSENIWSAEKVSDELSGLQDQIDNILSNVDPEALDSLTEIVEAFQNADNDLTDAIADIASNKVDKAGDTMTGSLNMSALSENIQFSVYGLNSSQGIEIKSDDDATRPTGNVTLKTGDASGSDAAGSIYIQGGANVDGNPGNILLTAGQSSGTGSDGVIVLDAKGVVYLNDNVDGSIDAGSHTIQNVADPVSDQDAATRKWVDNMSAIDNVIFVSPNANLFIADGSLNRPYATIAAALAVAVDNNVIALLPGTYSEPTVVIPSSLSFLVIQGVAAPSTIINNGISYTPGASSIDILIQKVNIGTLTLDASAALNGLVTLKQVITGYNRQDSNPNVFMITTESTCFSGVIKGGGNNFSECLMVVSLDIESGALVIFENTKFVGYLEVYGSAIVRLLDCDLFGAPYFINGSIDFGNTPTVQIDPASDALGSLNGDYNKILLANIPLSNLTQSSAAVDEVPIWNGTNWEPGIPTGSSTWGAISGTLADQTDLQEALDAKVAKAGDTMTGTLEIIPPLGDTALKIDSSPASSTSIEIRGLAAPFEISEEGGELTANSFLSPTSVSFDKYSNIGEYEQNSTYGFDGLILEKYNIVTAQAERQTEVNPLEMTLKTFDAHPSGNPSNSIEIKDGQITLETRISSLLLPSTPTIGSHVTTKNYVDTSIDSTINTISNQIRIPQAIYVNNSPSYLGYIATGSIQKPYQTIKAALDSIIDASAAKRYCLIIAPGTYNELNTIRLKGFVDLISIANDTVVINVAGGSRLLWSNNSPGRVFITDISIPTGIEVLNDNPSGTSGCVLDLDNVDTGTVIFNGRGGGRDFIQLRNDTRLGGSCTINSAATTIFDSTIIGNLNLTDVGCVAPDSFGSAITATLRSNYQLNVNITSTNFDIYVDAWGNNNVSTLTMTSNSAVPSTFNSDAISYPNTITLSGSPTPVVARTTQARAVSVNPVSGIVSTDVQSALEELKSQITSIDLSVSSEPTGFLDASQTTISFSDSTPDRTFTIAPVSSSFVFYANGEMFTKTVAQVVQIPNNEGNHYIYFDTDGVLKSTQVFDDSIILTKAFVSVVYWDVDNQKHVYFANERHGLVMDGQTHIHFHTVFGAQYIGGLALQNFTIGVGNSNADAQYTADEGTIRDEDLKIIIPAQLQIPTLYRSGAAGNWRRKEVDSFPFIYSGTEGYVGIDGRLPFNEFTGGAWQLSEIANNGFVLIHYFATNDIEYPIVAIQGQAQYTTIVDARISANSEISQLSGLPFAEFVAIGSVILQSADGYTNTVKARVRLTDTGSNYVDFRGTQILVAAATANDHGLLSGLDSDDHIQYHTDSRADTWFSDKTTDDLTEGTNNLYLDIPGLAAPSGLDIANDDLVIYSSIDTAHKKIKLNQLSSAVGSAGDIVETSASFLNNISTPTNVVGLSFSTAVVSSFEAQVVVSRGTKKEVFTLLGVQIDGDFSMSVESVGVDTGIDFTISDLGQVKYTSTDSIDGGTIKFRAITLTV